MVWPTCGSSCGGAWPSRKFSPARMAAAIPGPLRAEDVLRVTVRVHVIKVYGVCRLPGPQNWNQIM